MEDIVVEHSGLKQETKESEKWHATAHFCI